jgi:CheY-like chemotaxis protein
VTDTGPENTRILVVDDDSSIRSYLKELLSRRGYQVLEAENGKQALELAVAETPALILMDVFMPEMSGGVTAHRLSENMLTNRIPVIFLTSMITEEQEMEVESFDGSYVFLSKPIDHHKLFAEIDRALASAATSGR